jgi:hypothetical protein
MVVFVLMALVLAAVVAAAGVVLGTLALLVRAALWVLFFPIRLLFSLVAVPFVLGGLALVILAILAVSLMGALFVALGVLLAAGLSVVVPLALVFGACWLIARLIRRPALI